MLKKDEQVVRIGKSRMHIRFWWESQKEIDLGRYKYRWEDIRINLQSGSG
jgi:hypothetical protein